jgi:amino acid adenylation domain-containing protein
VYRILKGELVQDVIPKLSLTIPVIHLEPHEESDRDARLKSAILEEIKKPFDLSQGPLVRLALIQLSRDEHVLIINMHHIVTDLETTRLFVQELTGFYNAFNANRGKSSAVSRYQYVDYASEQVEWLSGSECASMLSFWKNKLKGKNSILNVATDNQRLLVKSYQGSVCDIELSEKLSGDVKSLGKLIGIPPFVVLLSAYFILLHRYSGQNDLIVGIPFSNRRKEELAHVLGSFVNILPLHCHVSGDMQFEEIAAKIRREMLEIHRNQEVSLELIIEELKLKRDASYNPLYQVAFTFHPPVVLTLDGVKVKPMHFHNGTSKLDMFFSLWDSGDQYRGEIEYNTDLFMKETMDRVVENYKTVLESIIEDTNKPVSHHTVLSGREYEMQFRKWNDTATPRAQSDLLHSAFERQAERNPHGIAVEHHDEKMTYKTLNERSNQLAHHLRELGAGPDILVGICVNRSVEMLVAALGVLKSGGAYIPLDPDFPAERLSYMLQHSEARILITEQSLIEALPQNACSTVLMDRDRDLISHKNTKNPVVETGSHHLAYVIYTSGSTGVPKGVMIPHIAAVNFLASMSKTPGMEEQDSLLAVTTLSFDISILELFLPLTVGAKTVIVDRETASDGKLLVNAIDDSNATIMQATPATWRLLLSVNWQGAENLKALCGGEAFPSDLAKELLGRCAEVWNMYGPTETTVWSTCYRVMEATEPVPIGRPIDNTCVYILDEKKQPVPIGVPGELYIGGAGVARGYLKQPEMTTERFIPDPFEPNDSARMYKTGDLCRYLPDGRIQYLNRMDNQVKLSGFRIELGEIESALIQHPLISETAVVLQGESYENQRLVAYIVPENNEKPAVDALRAFLQKSLPYYMLPSQFVYLEELPLTPNNKVDRKALPVPDQARPELEQVYLAPENDSEKKLAELWCQVLDIDKVGMGDNFFDVGGTSLRAVQLIENIKQTFNVDLSVVTLFQHPTIRAFVNSLNKDGETSASYSKIKERAQLRKSALQKRQRKVKEV